MKSCLYSARMNSNRTIPPFKGCGRVIAGFQCAALEITFKQKATSSLSFFPFLTAYFYDERKSGLSKEVYINIYTIPI